MPKTLLITAFYPPLIGGLEHYWREVARRWPKGEIVILTQPIIGTPDFDDDADLTIVRRPFFPLRWMRPSWLPFIKTIVDVISNHLIERLLFGHYANYALAGPLVKKVKGIPYDIITHGIDSVLPLQSRFGAWSMRQVFDKADTLYANSHQTEQHLKTLVNRPIIVAPPGIDYAEFPELSRDDIREQKGWKNKFVILFVGRLVAVKGVDVLLRAVSALSDKIDYELVIVGTGAEQGVLVNLSKALGIGDRVKFIGHVPDRPADKAPWYTGADLFVLPSRSIKGQKESFGLVCLEAARYALPVILTDDCGAKEIIDDGRTGQIIRSSDSSALTKAIESVWAGPDIYREQGRTLANIVHEKYTWDATVRTLVNPHD